MQQGSGSMGECFSTLQELKWLCRCRHEDTELLIGPAGCLPLAQYEAFGSVLRAGAASEC